MTTQLLESEYNNYYKRYIDQATSQPLLEGLAAGMLETHDFFKAIPAEKQEFRYDEGKWTPKEILLHIIDTERVFAYRALQFARSKGADLKGFDQDEFAVNSSANARSLDSLLKEYMAVRTASLCLFETFNAVALKSTGVASNSPLSARAAGFIICGHEKHHIAVIKERYL